MTTDNDKREAANISGILHMRPFLYKDFIYIVSSRVSQHLSERSPVSISILQMRNLNEKDAACSKSDAYKCLETKWLNQGFITLLVTYNTYRYNCY